jgi:signal transduction histidine kinase
MSKARLPDDEPRRLAGLRSISILDTPPEPIFDDIVRIASTICGVPTAVVTLIDADRQWFKARIGLEATETSRDLAFCAHAILEQDVFVVRDASTDARFADNPLVTGGPEIRFYAGAQLKLPSGECVGTLCLIDSAPRMLTPEMRESLLALKRQVEAHLALRSQAIALRSASAELLRLQVQKEQMVQFVVHDMKNALSALSMNTEALAEMTEPDGDVGAIVVDVLGAAAHLRRMVSDLLDLASAELGAPLRATPVPVEVDPIFANVASCFEGAARAAGVSIEHEPTQLIARADPYLLRRVVENLLSNALRFAPASSTVSLKALRHAQVVRIVVCDWGPGVPESRRETIFDLYQSSRDAASTSGIGLAFCRAALAVQGGRIWVEDSPPRGSSFCVEIPAA